MVIETKELKHPSMNHDARPKPGPTRRLFSDAVELAELQLELLKADGRDAAKSMVASLVIAVFAACLVLGAAPVLLTAGAHWLVESTELGMVASLALVSVGAIVVAGLLGAVAYGMAKRGAQSLERSRRELQRNLSWLKSTIASSEGGSTPRNAK